jgi:hypothetical protein
VRTGYRAAGLTLALLATVAEGSDAISLPELAPEAIAAMVDLRSFANSTGPRREEHLRTFADYGFTDVTIVDGTVELYNEDRSWMFAVTPLETTEDRAILCILDQALGEPTYHSNDAVAFELGAEALLVATGEEIEFPECRHIGE